MVATRSKNVHKLSEHTGARLMFPILTTQDSGWWQSYASKCSRLLKQVMVTILASLVRANQSALVYYAFRMCSRVIQHGET